MSFFKIILLSLLISTSFFCSAQQDSCEIILQDNAFSSIKGGYFLAGNINSWNPADSNYLFHQTTDGIWKIKIAVKKDQKVEYKITRGSWGTVEINADGTDMPNRILINDGTVKKIFTSGWKNDLPPVTTASPNVHVLDTAFYIPQLNRYRKIWIYLPADYKSSNKRYPVVYMHDGRNLFDVLTSGYGEWGVDECMDTLSRVKDMSAIIVGIDNSEYRTTEYNAYDNDRFGKGEGKQYVDFIVETLKPFIDKKYRTFKDPSNTIIAGSSLGGLISYYAALNYPKVFGKCGVFSPAFWIAPEIDTLTMDKGRSVTGKIFFYIGEKEGKRYVDDMESLIDKLATISDVDIYKVIDEEGQHNEAAWRKWFPEFMKWILVTQYKLPVMED